MLSSDESLCLTSFWKINTTVLYEISTNLFSWQMNQYGNFNGTSHQINIISPEEVPKPEQHQLYKFKQYFSFWCLLLKKNYTCLSSSKSINVDNHCPELQSMQYMAKPSIFLRTSLPVLLWCQRDLYVIPGEKKEKKCASAHNPFVSALLLSKVCKVWLYFW